MVVVQSESKCVRLMHEWLERVQVKIEVEPKMVVEFSMKVMVVE